VYRGFTERDPLQRDWDFSDDALQELRQHETFGEIDCSLNNGYYHGKWLSSITVDMWKEGLRERTLFKCELYDDLNYPDWWLDKVLKKI
jgi:hypothetical protein